MPPQTMYARSGELSLAYQVFGDGDVELVLVPSFVSNLDLLWAHPGIKAFLDHLGGFVRVAIFDKAGTGLSDPVSGIPTVERRAAEIEAVIDAAGFARPALFGMSEGGPSSIVLASTKPERVRALILAGAYAIAPWSIEDRSYEEVIANLTERGLEPRYHPSREQFERMAAMRAPALERWGSGETLATLLPSGGDRRQLGLIERASASPGMTRATLESAFRLDVREALASIAIPTLVIHATDDAVPVQLGHYLADHIPGAQMLEVRGHDHAPWFNDPKRILAEVEKFLTGTRHAPRPNRVLATVLFTDIVDSTRRAAELGDERWRAVLERHAEVTRDALGRFDGREVKSTGDGFLATFFGPAQAIRCAEEIRDAVGDLGIEVRAGVHTGECEVIGQDVGGIAVHIGARVGAMAGPGEVLCSSTVRDLVIGSGIGFSDRGEHELKGVPGRWRLLMVRPEGPEDGSAEARVTGIPTPPARQGMRAGDRAAGVLARRAPGIMRAAARLAARTSRSR